MADPKKKPEDIVVWSKEKNRAESYDPNPGFLGKMWEGMSSDTSQEGRVESEAIRRRRKGQS